MPLTEQERRFICEQRFIDAVKRQHLAGYADESEREQCSKWGKAVTEVSGEARVRQLVNDAMLELGLKPITGPDTGFAVGDELKRLATMAENATPEQFTQAATGEPSQI